MPFIAKTNGEKKFGENTRVLSIRVPESQFELIKTNIKDFVDNYTEDNIKKIATIQDSIEEIISICQDVHDYIKKEYDITESKYLEIFDKHNIKLINSLIDKFPIERKTPIKTLTEEKREEKERKKEEEPLPIPYGGRYQYPQHLLYPKKKKKRKSRR